ncbi:glycosyltransferase [Kocuria rosea]|uniref:glycosyltransferase n=1 Tax=Kocuria rosea TaxID=1275 RepID=UPI00203E19C2|nr:glycosyltransferase [Kocuria rosea]
MTSIDRFSTATYYHTARTAHLERLADGAPDYFFYSKRRLDFDESVVPAGVRIDQVNCLGLVAQVIRRGVSVLEVPEPMAIKLWPQLLTIHSFLALGKIAGILRVDLVSYCIENLPVAEKLRAKTGLPMSLCSVVARIIVRFLLRTSTRVVFGTEASRDVYAKCADFELVSLVEHSLVWHLPSAKEPLDLPGSGVVFVGTFERRKGIFDLMSAWPEVLKCRPDAKLLLIGMGEELEHVRRFCAMHDSVILVENPPRSFIFSSLKKSKVLVLFSRRTPIWREQVGLPIIEALAHGCEIVTSDETGLSNWLRTNGHYVLPCTAGPSHLASAIVTALESSRDKRAIQSVLPRLDGRDAANRYLFSPGKREQ